jgi:ABC-type multidrug transport system ATPase subunit
MSAAAIQAAGITKRYGRATVLDDITFTIQHGEKVALTGANGAGKSTLLAVLCTLAAPTGGDATIMGHALSGPTARLRRAVGVLLHRPMLYEELTPVENLRFFARLYGVADAERVIEELLRAVGLWRRRDEPTSVLSRGTHQRLAIARALVHAPPVLLLDEPETGLDADAIEILDRLMLCAPGVTVLAATHRLDRVDAWADARLHLERGRLASASARELAQMVR